MKSDATCQTCKHLGVGEKRYASRYHYCTYWVSDSTLDGFALIDPPDSDKDTDGGSYFPLDFGCNHYEPKETESTKGTY